MGERIGAARTRELGDWLRQWREQFGVSGHDLAYELGWSDSKLSRIENGRVGVSEIDMVRYMAHCGVRPQDVDEALDMYREPGAPGYWLSKRLSALIFHETAAASSASYDPVVVPGLLQTEEYATEVVGADDSHPASVRYWVGTRMERQRILHSRRFAFYIHEHALRLPVGGGRLMNEQLLKLTLLTEQPQLTIRLIPAALGARSVFHGEFVLFRFAEHSPLVYLDSSGLFIEDREQVTRYEAMLTRLSDVALGKRESRAMLAALASEFDRPEDSPNAPDKLAEEQFQHRRRQ